MRSVRTQKSLQPLEATSNKGIATSNKGIASRVLAESLPWQAETAKSCKSVATRISDKSRVTCHREIMRVRDKNDFRSVLQQKQKKAKVTLPTVHTTKEGRNKAAFCLFIPCETFDVLHF